MGLFDNMYGFNPNTIQPFTYPQQRMTTQVSSPSVDLPRVHGYDGAIRFPLGPNSRIALFDDSEDIMYIKQTDAGGYPTITKFRFTLEPDNAVQNSQFVTVDEFNKFKEEFLNGQQFVSEPRRSKHSSSTNGQSKKHDADV